MGYIQMLMVALSVAAAYGGSYGADRLMDRFGRIPPPHDEQADSIDNGDSPEEERV